MAVASPAFRLIVACLLGVPAAAGAGPSDASIIADGAGDVELRALDQPVQRGDLHRQVDLRGAWIANETADAMEFGFKLSDWSDPFRERALLGRITHVGFAFQNTTFAAIDGFAGKELVGCGLNQALLGRTNNEALAPWTAVACLNRTVEPSQGIAHIEVPKRLIHDGRFVPIQPGEQIEGLYARSRRSVGAGSFVDRAPDSGFGPSFRSFVSGEKQIGDLILSAQDPIRASNGESTSILFALRLTNLAERTQTAAISASDLPSSWRVRVPPRILVGPGETVTFPLILAMNFTHDHGKLQKLVLRADSLEVPGHFGEVHLGVLWLDVPQPAGHHNRLWLHSRPKDLDMYFADVPGTTTGMRAAWVNAAERDSRPGVTDDEVPGYTLPGSMKVEWTLPLDPALQVGLDMDEGGVGVFETTLKTAFPSASATLDVEVHVCDPTGRIPGRATTQCSAEGRGGTLVSLVTGSLKGLSLAANANLPIHVDLRTNASVDVIPFAAGRTLALSVSLTSDAPQGVYPWVTAPAAKLLPASTMLVLPLEEYHDPIDAAFQRIGSVELRPLGPPERLVNPGRTTLFRFEVANVQDSALSLDLSTAGLNADWASVNPESVPLAGFEVHEVRVAVSAPLDAQPGERAELFLIAQSRAESHVAAVARMRASVVDVEKQDVPDETAATETMVGRGPAPNVSLFLLGLFACLVIRRWRRRPLGAV